MTSFRSDRKKGEDYPGERKVYLGDALGIYATEDGLDQILCTSAAKLGYDIVILENMPGSHQIVTEVLDTRLGSFRYLWFKN